MEPKKPSDPDQLGGWRINGRLGEGGFGTVFLAEKGAQKAAIKVIRREFVQEDDARSRLAIEAEVLSKLSDPFIGKILDSDLSGEFPWIATEFINGPTLEVKVKYEGPLEEVAWFNLAANIFHAILTANEFGVIHKDIKPSNIVLGETGNKLIDFGIAHISGQTRTAVFGDLEGSTPYSSPEHFTTKPHLKMDVFSLAATLAFAAKGKSIWKGDNDLQLMRSINEDYPDLDGLSKNQMNFLVPLLQKNPSDRLSAREAYQSALQYIEFLHGRSEKPRQIKTRQGHKRAWHSRRLILLIVAVCFLFTAFILQTGVFSNKDSEKIADQCETSLQNGNLELAIEICTSASNLGNLQAKLSLARAYLANGSNTEAKVVLQDCKSRLLGCKSDYAYFFQTGKESLANLTSAHSAGDKDAGWRIGNYYKEKGDEKTALSWYQMSSKAQNPVANIYLAIYWGDREEYAKAIKYAKLALKSNLASRPSLLKIDRPIERLIKTWYELGEDIQGKLKFFTKCANEKVVFCISTVAETYLSNKDFENAKKWGMVGANLQDAKSMWVLARVAVNKNARLPQGTRDSAIDKEIVGWYEKAAALGDVQSSYALGISYGWGLGSLKSDFRESCAWFQKTMAAITERKGTYLEEPTDQENFKSAAQFFELQSCQRILLGDNPALSFAPESPSPSATRSPSPSATRSPAPSSSPSPMEIAASPKTNPVLSSDQFSLSAPLSRNVVQSSIFGRAFKDNSNYWRIILTNFTDEKVPEITAIQFRMIGYTGAEWMNVPYKLKIDPALGTIYAQVDDFLFSVIFKERKYCPEFRAVKEEGGQIVQIWEKGQPECSLDYNP